MVLPDWVTTASGLSSDADLRSLQLRWLRDEIWMRRAVLCVGLLIPAVNVGILLVAPSTVSLAAGAASLLGVPLAYFFGRGSRRRA